MNTPYDGQQIPSTSSEITVTGAFSVPGRGIRVEAWDFDTHSWYLEDLFVLTDNAPLDGLGYPVDWYGFYNPVRLNDARYWLPRVNSSGGVSSSAARARIRVTADGFGPLVVLPPGYAFCTAEYPDLNTAIANCGDYGSQFFANLSTPGYSESGYVSRPISVGRHQSLALSNDRADEHIHDAAVIMQREDPDANGQRAGDWACPVRFYRSGNVSTVTSCPAVIDSLQDQECYFNQGVGERTVIVVENVGYCYGDTDTTFDSLWGCTSRDSRNVMVVQSNFVPGTQAAVLWAHELAHSFLGGGHSPDNYNLLGLSLQNSRRMTQFQCNEVLNGN